MCAQKETTKGAQHVGTVMGLNMLGNIRDLVTGKFGDAAYGLRSYLKITDSWNETAACEL